MPAPTEEAQRPPRVRGGRRQRNRITAAKAALDKLEGKKVKPEGSLAATAKAALDQLEGKKVKADKGRATTGRGAGPADEAEKPASPPAGTAAAALASAANNSPHAGKRERSDPV